MTRYVYFIQGASGGPIKIGSTNDIKKRLWALNTGSPVPLRLLAFSPDLDECTLHTQFAEYRIKGEWFADSEPVMRLVNKYRPTQPGQDPEEEPESLGVTYASGGVDVIRFLEITDIPLYEIARRTGAHFTRVYGWKNGDTVPGGVYLARLIVISRETDTPIDIEAVARLYEVLPTHSSTPSDSAEASSTVTSSSTGEI